MQTARIKAARRGFGIALTVALLLGVVDPLVIVSVAQNVEASKEPTTATADAITTDEAEDGVPENVQAFVKESLQGEGDHSFSDFLWMGIAGFLVFFMQAGFALVESGFTRSKNTVNILMKNLLDFCLGSMAFWAVGFGIMYGSSQGGFLGTGRWFLSDAVGADGSINNWEYMEWFFQVVFAATSATIVSGAMAERTNFKGYLIYSVVISALIYPIQGHWIWGGGFLAKLGFHDFAGSTVVHSVGGWAALMGAILLGPRLGKFDSKRNPRVIPGHSIPLAVTGVFILWLGWFGFNPGSTLGASTSFARIAVTTNLAACAGGLAAMFFAWAKVKKPDVGLTLNGVLAGLVAITAPCAVVSPGSAIIIGAIAGVLCTLFVDIMERTFKVDDPVGAFAVHGVNGVWGTLAVGLFAADPFASATGVKAGLLFGGGLAQLVSQAIGIGVVAVWTLATTGILFGVLKAAGLLRVSADEEMEGLDAGEHGTHAYHHDDQTGRSIAFAGEGD